MLLMKWKLFTKVAVPPTGELIFSLHCLKPSELLELFGCATSGLQYCTRACFKCYFTDPRKPIVLKNSTFNVTTNLIDLCYKHR
jgi:hypothetical protein